MKNYNSYTVSCPHCFGTKVKKNGKNTTKKKQKFKCKDCKRTFVIDGNKWLISVEERIYIDKMLAERISLRGICRVMGISLSWLLSYVKSLYAKLRDDLNYKVPKQFLKSITKVDIKVIDSELDEMCSFVGKKKNKRWIWIALCRTTRQVIAFHVGDRGRDDAKLLWRMIPNILKNNSNFYTDDWDAYKGVLPKKRHFYSKIKKETNHIERFNNTVRQRVSRLVRKALSFSKIIENHKGAIKYFFCCYNLEKQKALATTL